MRQRELFNALMAAMAQHYSVNPESLLRGDSFSLTVPQASLLGENIQQRSDFLKRINLDFVTDIKGYKLRGATEKAITGRKKAGRYLAELDHKQDSYECAETDSGIIIPWRMFDNFARHKDRLAELYGEYVQTQIALDMITIGWNGTSIADNTSAGDLSDVNKGWFQQVREQRPENMVKQGAESGKIKIFGSGADFENLDQLAYSLKHGLDIRHQARSDLIFLVGSDLVAMESELITKGHGLTPTEKAALGINNLMGSFGGMSAITPPNFPTKGAVVTTLDNLSIYVQEDSVRRSFRSDEDRKGIINSYYRNEAYVVEDTGLFVGIEAANVKLNGEA